MLNLEDISRIRLIIAGVSIEQLLTREGLSENDFLKSKSYTYYLGRVDFSIIKSLYSLSDFTLLIKPEKKRFSSAGFPTKVSESLAFGVPVICNISSDLSDFLTDGLDSIILKDDSAKSFYEAILHVLHLKYDDIANMRKNARYLSEKKLDIDSFKESFSYFLGNLK